MEIGKSGNIFFFSKKKYTADFALKHLLLIEIGGLEICTMFVYKHTETIEFGKKKPAF